MAQKEMTSFFLKIYDFLQQHKRLYFGLLTAITSVLVGVTLTLQYNENITDFLPLNETTQKAMTVYQELSNGQKVIIVFENTEEKPTQEESAATLAAAIDTFATKFMSGSGSGSGIGSGLRYELTTQVDFEKYANISDFVYSNIPLMLTEDDYLKIEKRLTEPDFYEKQLSQAVESMMLPAPGAFGSNIAKDPLSLFSSVMKRLQLEQQSMPFEIDDGYIYTPDHKKALALITSPYGAMESANNAKLVEYVDSITRQTMAAVKGVEVNATGAPVIAVDNARQIKQDSLLAIAIAVTLIIALLIYSFRELKNLCFIVVAIVFGWLFAMSGMSFFRDSLSLIVIGIGSIIIGIAVNYPLHFVAHDVRGGSTREILKDMVSPLLIGNITTVGAFAALIPLEAPALRDLGTFAAFMLIGTILFVLIFLPHIVKGRQHAEERLPFGKIAVMTPERHKWILPLIAVLTIIFAYFSLDTSFDADIKNINYLSDKQKALLESLQREAAPLDTTSVYLVTEGRTWEEALDKNIDLKGRIDSLQAAGILTSSTFLTTFISSPKEQQKRIERWNKFCNEHKDEILTALGSHAQSYGFSENAFDGFKQILNASYTTHGIDYFEPLTSTIFSGSLSRNGDTHSVVQILKMKDTEMHELRKVVDEVEDNAYSFDLRGMNSSIANALSDNFNYIGYACSFIVFLFLWLSFGRLELALIAFLPMAVSWIWILGIMQIFSIQFNIVNIILATFIFGQGDDYTIFMVDGLINEYAHKKKLLPSYKNSIIISALIMFIGMGSLIVAKHPAIHSLAEVTIVGMFTVVLMAWMLPPIVFRWMTTNNGIERHVPITMEQIVRTSYCALFYLAELPFGIILCAIAHITKSKKMENFAHRAINACMRFNVHHVWGVESVFNNPYDEQFTKSSIIVSNHQSMLDPIWLLALHPKVVVIVGKKVWRNPLVHFVLKLSRCYTTDRTINEIREYVKKTTADGYNIVFFPESGRYCDNTVHRFHTGAFMLAQELDIDILPIYIHGTGHVMPKHSGLACKGQITIEVGKRITSGMLTSYGDTYQKVTHNVQRVMSDHYQEMRREIEDTHYFRHLVKYKTIYTN